jgi:hypothetical protein
MLQNGAGGSHYCTEKEESVYWFTRLQVASNGAIVITVQADQGLASRDLDTDSQHLHS